MRAVLQPLYTDCPGEGTLPAMEPTTTMWHCLAGPDAGKAAWGSAESHWDGVPGNGSGWGPVLSPWDWDGALPAD